MAFNFLAVHENCILTHFNLILHQSKTKSHFKTNSTVSSLAPVAVGMKFATQISSLLNYSKLFVWILYCPRKVLILFFSRKLMKILLSCGHYLFGAHKKVLSSQIIFKGLGLIARCRALRLDQIVHFFIVKSIYINKKVIVILPNQLSFCNILNQEQIFASEIVPPDVILHICSIFMGQQNCNPANLQKKYFSNILWGFRFHNLALWIGHSDPERK